MVVLSLKISVVEKNVAKTIQFDPSTIVYDACRIIREKIAEANIGQPGDYGLFLADEDPKKGVWLENVRSLEYYMLRNGDLLEYKKKIRTLRVRMLDGSVKTLLVDDSKNVGDLMVAICTRIGISNYDEYSLVIEPPEEQKEQFATLRKEKEKTLPRSERRMEELRRKLHTDEEIKWVDHGKTLREQGLDEGETLLLRRKYFFSDQNIDSRDPVQLNLLYVQCRDAIIDGTHPVSQSQAVQFAGIQCQIQFGDHVETKHKTGFLDLKEFLPKEYCKVKGVEKKIYVEHKKCAALNELEAKVKYTHLCRSLKTYGVTFFVVKEKLKGKNRLVPRLLGITKHSVLRVDEKTKEILKEWPLTHVRRWAASPNSFTLDFGDYSDHYYSVQTPDGEQISQLIAGYIDIILKKKKAKDHFGIEGDDESTLLEDTVSPYKATIIEHQTQMVSHPEEGSVALPGVMRSGDGESQYKSGSMEQEQTVIRAQLTNAQHMPPMGNQAQMEGPVSHAQKALITNIGDSMDTLQRAQMDLQSKADMPPLGTDPASLEWKETTMDVSRQAVSSELSAINTGTAQVVNLTGGEPDDTDYTAVGSAVTTISSNFEEMSKNVRVLAALMESDEDGERLLEASRRLAAALSDLMKAAEPESKEPRQTLLNAASKVGDASGDVMKRAGVQEVDQAYQVKKQLRDMYKLAASKISQDTLLALAKAVANATAQLVLNAKNVAGSCEEQPDQNRVINSATQAALATSELVACAKVVAPTINSPACQEQLVEAAKHVAKSVEGIVGTSKDVCDDDQLMGDLNAAATQVSKALNDLLQHIKKGSTQPKSSQHDEAVDTILTTTDKLFLSMGNASEMVKQARILAQATSQLVNAIKGEAEQSQDSDLQKRLLAAAKLLADATARMVEAAKGCATNPNDPDQQQRLRLAAEDLRSATNAAAQNALKKKLISRLELAAKQAASASTQTIAAAQKAGSSNKNQASQQELVTDCKATADLIPKLVQGIKSCMNEPDNPQAQLALISASQQFLTPAGNMVSSAKAAVPTVGDQAASMQLGTSAKNLQTALAELRAAAGKAQEACGSLELDSALDTIRQLDKELETIKYTARDGRLLPLPGETMESSALKLGGTSKQVGSSMAQLLSAAAQGDESYTGIAARETANSLRTLKDAVRGVAASTDDKEVQEKIIEAARDVMDKSGRLLEEAKAAVNNPNNPDNQQRLAQVAKAVSNALNNCVSCLPGQRDVDSAIKVISNVSQQLSVSRLPDSQKSYADIQSQLNNDAARLNEAAGDVVTASKTSPAELGNSSQKYGDVFCDFLDSGMQMASVTKDSELQGRMVTSMKNISMVSSRFLLAAKSVSADPSAPNAKNQLAAAARALTEAINDLLNLCSSSAPGQQDCDNALRQIRAMRPLLENPSEPVNDATYYECLDIVMDNSKQLGTAMTGIANTAKKGELEEFGKAVREVADAVCALIEAAAQSSYLVGIADPSSEAGRPGLVDQAQFARASQAIQVACQNLINPTSNQQQVLQSATIIAKHTSSLCNSCRIASSKTNNPVAKRQFVQSAKDVANATANLVKAIKVLDSEYSDVNRAQCAQATKPLIEAVDNLTIFASSPEFASIPAKISNEARQAQEPITSAGKTMIDGSCCMITAAKSLSVNPKDPPTWQLLAAHSKNVSDSIKKLVTSIRDKAPGQKECDEAIYKINVVIKALDHASLAAVSQNLAPRTHNSLQGFQDQMIGSTNEIIECVDDVRIAGKQETEKLGHYVSKITVFIDPLADASIGTASKTMNSKRQMALLDQTKTVAECALQLVHAAKEGGGNPKASEAHEAIDESADGLKDALNDLLDTLDEAATEAGAVTVMVDQLNKAIIKTDDRLLTKEIEEGDFVEYQTTMTNALKEIARASNDMTSKSTSDPSALSALSHTVTTNYSIVAANARGAAMTAGSPEIQQRIRQSVHELGQACVTLVKSAGECQNNPNDTYTQREVAENSRIVQEKVTFVLSALQAGSRGTQACINAASTVSGIIGDLDTTILFATAGTLHPENEAETFSDHRENILKTAKALVEDTKTLVAGAASSQEQLAAAAQSAVRTITRLADVVKYGAASLGSDQSEAQVLLINAVKDVAMALGELIQSTKNASGKSVHDPAMANLKDSAKVMVTNVTSLLKTVKTVEDEAARGTRAVESAISAINQDLKAFDSNEPPRKVAKVDDLIQATKPITSATARTVAAGNSTQQHDAIVAANMGRKAVTDLLETCKAVARNTENEEAKQKVMETAREAASQYMYLLQILHEIMKDPAYSKSELIIISRRIATAINELSQYAEFLKEEESYHSELTIQHRPKFSRFGEHEIIISKAHGRHPPEVYQWTDEFGVQHRLATRREYDVTRSTGDQHTEGEWPANDMHVIAERELLDAAASIEAASKKLAAMRPANVRSKENEGEMNFEEQILEAAKSLTNAVAALIKSATAAQRELVMQGKVSGASHYAADDTQWSQGLISAAQMVAAATQSLCEAANAVVQGMAGEEKLISAAKQVASSTAQLLVACKVKMDADSPAMVRLQSAGNAVKRSSDLLVRAAQETQEWETDRYVLINKRLVGGIAQEIMAQEDILRKERELQEARYRLVAIRKARYTEEELAEQGKQNERHTDGESDY